MNEKQEQPVQSAQEKVSSLRKLVAQAKKELDFKERELSLRERMYKFESEHREIINDKPAWLLSPEYMDLTMEMKSMQLEGMSIGMKDNIERLKSGIKGMEKEIIAIGRNHKPKLVEEPVEEVKKDD